MAAQFHPGRGRHAGEVDVVLEADGNAIERAARGPVGAAVIGCCGGLPRVLGRDGIPGVELWVEAVDPRQIVRGEIAGGKFAGGKACRQTGEVALPERGQASALGRMSWAAARS
jgi:hypothetical protein